MSEDCVFCSIVDGEIPARTVYETESVLAFLDANPLALGHTLVIPKAHHRRVTDLPPDLSGPVMEAIRAVTAAVESAVDADATTIALNNGTAAGQEVPHVHGHVVPRFEADGGRPIHALVPDRPEVSDDELEAVGDSIREAVEAN